MGYLYVLQSSKSGRYYVGSAIDPDRRLTQHNSNSVKATRNRGPWSRVALLAFADVSAARKAEAYVKKLKSRRLVELIICGDFRWPLDLVPTN